MKYALSVISALILFSSCSKNEKNAKDFRPMTGKLFERFTMDTAANYRIGHHLNFVSEENMEFYMTFNGRKEDQTIDTHRYLLTGENIKLRENTIMREGIVEKDKIVLPTFHKMEGGRSYSGFERVYTRVK